MANPPSLSKQFDDYKTIREISACTAIGGLIGFIFFTFVLALVTQGFKLTDYQLPAGIWYGGSGIAFLGGLIVFAIATCKQRSLYPPLQENHTDPNEGL